MRKFLLLIPFALFLTFCTLSEPAQPAQDVSAIINATLTAAAQNPGIVPQSASSGIGSLAGKLNYPADSMPPLKVFAFLVGSDQFFSVDTAAGQMDYKIDNLPEGKYHVVGYATGTNDTLSGGYTQAVLCGMTETCTDHTLVDVIVFGGEATTDVNVFDWFQPDFPPMPGSPSVQSAQPAPAGLGAISGQLMFPASSIPSMKVVAFNIETSDTYTVITPPGQGTYQIDNLPAGRYFVVAYSIGGDGFTAGVAGGYTAAVPCGLSTNCTDHALLEVKVVPNNLTQGIVPGDFYAPESTFPPMP